MTQRLLTLGLIFLIALTLTAHSRRVATDQAGAAAQPITEADGVVATVGTRPRRVLALYSESSDQPVMVAFAQEFHAALKRQSGNSVEHYTEFVDSTRFPGREQARLMCDYLHRKYADRTIDAVFAWGPFTLPLVLEYRSELFPDTPVVYYSGSLEDLKDYPQRPMTGILNPNTYVGTLEVALSLHPDTREVFVISGTPSRDKATEREVSRQLQAFQSRVRFTYLTDLPLHQLIAAVKAVPKQSIIIYSRHEPHDEPGKVLELADYVDLVSRSAPVPVYGPFRSSLGYGTVGGVVDDREASAAAAAAIVLRVASGTRPEDIPPERTPRIPTFDARQLRRWGISEDRLPPGSVVLYREPTIWSQYRGYIIGTGALLAVQTVLIGGLLVQRARRRRTEQALHDSEKRYALATAAASVGVWDWNLETGELFVDPALKRALGVPDRDIESLDAWMEHAHADDAGRFRLDARTHLAAGTPFFEHERRMRHRDGSIRWFLTRGSAVREADGRLQRIVGTDTDITDRKRVEARLEETQREFTRIARVTTLAEFAGSVAHEVSQPLAAIVMHSKACLRWLAGGGAPTAELREALQDIVEAANRADEIVTHNRELFRHHTATRHALDIRGIVKDVVMLVKPRLDQRLVALTVELDDTLPLVCGDRVELQQVLLNLLVNSIEALDLVDAGSRRITVATRLTGDNMVQVTVQDTGIGLRDIDASRLFAPFYTTKSTGTGIGLSICRTIVESHGGTLWAEPGSGPGATFGFAVPAAGPACEEHAGEEDQRRQADGGFATRDNSQTSAATESI